MIVSLMMLLPLLAMLLATVTGELISNGSPSVNNVVLIPVTDAIIIDEYDESLMLSADGCTDSLLLSQLPTFYHIEIVASHEIQERRRREKR